MKTITVTEETFDSLFKTIENDFGYMKKYMDRDETLEEFKKTLTYRLFIDINDSLSHLKKELKRLT